MDDLIVAVRRHAIGDTVKLTVRRGDQTLTLDVVVGDKPTDFKMPSTDTSAHRRASSVDSTARQYEKAPASRRGLRHSMHSCTVALGTLLLALT